MEDLDKREIYKKKKAKYKRGTDTEKKVRNE